MSRAKNTPGESRSWKSLTRHASDQLHQADPEQLPLRHEAAGLLLDLSKQRLSRPILNDLLALANEFDLPERIDALFSGARINVSEDRPALHTALRAPISEVPELAQPAASVMAQVLDLAEQIRQGRWLGSSGRTILDVVHIGIGGSHLGPELVVEALTQPWHQGPRIHFVANIDGTALANALADLNPERTLFIIASKSFSTLETRTNAMSARAWFLERVPSLDAISRHFIAISTNLDAAGEFGIPAQNVFAMWDWVGGRYSVWSPVGLPLALAIGRAGFEAFLQGAHALDQHFRTAPLEANLPVLMALVGIWNYNFLGITSQAVLPYAERLRLLPDFLQQLTMESNGKGVRQDGTEVGIHTMPVLWGGRGTNGQHAYHQLLHQGTRSVAADFILIATSSNTVDRTDSAEHQRWLLANALAQSQAMLLGHEDGDPHKNVTGNKGTTTIILDSLTPESLGALLALYEHMVFCQGVIWNINSFDQWGVELGKRLAIPIYEQLGGKTTLRQDPSTRGLIEHLIRLRTS